MAPSVPPLQWTVLRDGALAGFRNMARDHALARVVAPGRAYFRLYRWDGATISFGRNEPARLLYDREAIARDRLAVVRRFTGGRAVLHDRELTYAVAIPTEGLRGVRARYQAIHRGLARGLASLGVPVGIAGERTGANPAPDAGPCFTEPACGEIVAGGRKLVGSAQARLETALVQHGSILIADDQTALREVGSAEKEVALEGSPASLSDFLDPLPSWTELEEAVVAGVRDELGGEWVEGDVGELPQQAALEERYRSDDWTWRR